MSRLKVLIGAILLVVAFFVFRALNDTESEFGQEANKTTRLVSAEKIVVTKKQAKLYKARQAKLTLALKKYFNTAINSGDIVGAGVSIVHGDSILIATGFGKRQVGQKAIVNGQTIFRLGSLSKGFAGVLAASLQTEGKFDWNNRVTDFIPKFQLGDSINTAKIKIAHVLSHSSGTPYHSFTNLVEANIPVATIASRFHEVTPQSEPGIQYSYQNAMFSLSQEVMRSVTGKDVKTLLRNRFFKPLNMTTISMKHTDLMEANNVAMPHGRSGKGWKSRPLTNRYYNAVVAGGINASSLDMAKWMRFLLGGNPEVLPFTTIEKAFDPFIEIADNNKYYQRWPGHKQSYYGFGWRIHEFQQSETAPTETVWHHGGSVNSYRNEIALFPNDNIGICVLLNGNSRFAQTVIPDLYELVKSSHDLRPLQSNPQEIIK